ncbi:dual specificity phosphatase 12 [Microdochium nivale]|nr:dual specificity phosphatase 12 [Microdochium nivale]
MTFSRVPGRDRLYVGGIWSMNMESQRQQLHDQGVTHILSVIEYSFDHWGDEARRFPHHLSIDIDDDEDMDLLAHFPDAVRFIDEGLFPPGPPGEERHGGGTDTDGHIAAEGQPSSPGAVYVHCAMGKSRSVSCVVAYLLHKYPHRFGGDGRPLSAMSPPERRATARAAVEAAVQLVREGRSIAEPNPGFMAQLRLWWAMGCPAAPGALENHPVYQKWLYERLLREARDAHMPPDAGNIRFEDEIEAPGSGLAMQQQKMEEDDHGTPPYSKEIRCKKCRRTLATPGFVLPHAPAPSAALASGSCAHIFIDTLSWMRPALEDGALEGRLNCPGARCGATVGRFAWQGMMCSCRQWVVPAFSLNRSRIDELVPRPAAAATGLGVGSGRGSGGNL